MMRTPAIHALLIQLAAFVLVLLLAVGLRTFAGTDLNILSAALVHGAAAALISYWRRLAAWWFPIQFIFPVALLTVHALRLPSWLFLAAFLALTCLYWTTFRTQVPFFPSGPATWHAVAGLLPEKEGVRVVDVGSGLGGLILHLARLRPEGEFSGIEVAPLPWLISALRARLAGSRGRFIRGDYDRLAFAGFDVVFAYLSPAAMPALWAKARAEMRPGTLLLSHEFPIPGVEPSLIIPGAAGRPSLFGWHM
ncbi:class I SAM-dependent methyltransferase [Noviherbaspirillum massiliense]|uniref:class I SAM-dependent methyltransferase n=1 Tax=Noviherbaspirillum massiliense TaxID=1465823 RepID=UPI0003605E91|nr:class I SAM-dependent methyltransferase [Noviherbaspirillum massiliense]